MNNVERSVIITGGTKGLGRALSLEFGRAGWRVVAVYCSDLNAAQELELQFRTEGIHGNTLRHDVASGPLPEIPSSAQLVLIHNACASFQPKPLHLLVWEDFEQQLAVAVRAGLYCAQSVLRPMVQRGGGVIVTVLSKALQGTVPKGFGAYNTGKMALLGLTRSLASEYASRGIRAFAVSPGFMHTALTAAWDARMRDAILQAGHPPLDPCDIARKIHELVLDPAQGQHGEDYML